MNLHLSRRNLLILILLLVILLFSSVGSYFLKIDPLKKQAATAETNLKTQEKLLETIVQNSNKEEVELFEDSTNLQEKIPVEPLLGQFLLDLEKAEVVSGSVISNMTFSETDVTVPNNEGQALPAGMKRITVKMNVISPNFYGLFGFLEAVEGMERITKIDSIQFSGPNERRTLDGEEEGNASNGLTFPVVISTFYHPGLQELADELPKRYSPEPSNKMTPLAEPGSIDSGIKEDDSVEVIKPLPDSEKDAEKPNNTQKVEPPAEEKEENKSEYNIIKHKVKQGETLYSISIKYFKNRSGEEMIRKWNKMPNNNVIVGEVLDIPIKKK